MLPEEISKVDLKELEVLLSKVYEELKENISQDMKNYLEKKIKFYSFLCDFHSSKDPIELFANQPEVDYEIDKYLLFDYRDYRKTKEKELLSEVNNMVELLKKHERFTIQNQKAKVRT